MLSDKFLSGLENLPSPGSQRQTFMEIGGYAHHENICSNILQFYLTPTNEHGFGRLLLDSLLTLIDRELINDDQNIEVHREVCTSENNRIDLVIISDKYIIGIENKIHAKVGNPFCDYAKHLNSLNKDSSKVHKILLSVHPEKELAKLRCFNRVSYTSFLHEIEEKFGSPAYVVISSAYLNNWSVRVACRRHSGNYLNKQANNFSFIKSKFLNP